MTKEEAEKVAFNVWRWAQVAATKDIVIATRIGDILDKYDFNDDAQHIRGKCVLSPVCINTVQDPFKKTQLF